MHFQPKLDRFSQDLLLPGRLTDNRGWIVGDGFIEGLQGPIQRAVGVETIRQIAFRYPEETGLTDVELANQQAIEIEVLEATVEELRAQIEQLEARQERISGLARDGFKVQKVQGRPKSPVAA